jgi:small subunit ribosomal protein S8e
MLSRRIPRGFILAQWQGVSKRKSTGGRKVKARGKRSTEISSEKQLALVGESKRKIYRKTGGNTLVRVLMEDKVSVSNPKTGKTERTTIKTVVESPANPNYVRRNVLTKGAVIDTEMGHVRITSRPGHDGVINGVLLD